MDFLRLIYIPVISILLGVGVIWLVKYALMKLWLKNEGVGRILHKICWSVSILLGIAALVIVVHTAISYQIPQSIIDRSDVKQQNEQQ